MGGSFRNHSVIYGMMPPKSVIFFRGSLLPRRFECHPKADSENKRELQNPINNPTINNIYFEVVGI